jgi:hypothetical protein
MVAICISETSATLPTSILYEDPKAESTTTMNHRESLKLVTHNLVILFSPFYAQLMYLLSAREVFIMS